MTSSRIRILATGGLVAVAVTMAPPPAGAAEGPPDPGGPLAERCTGAIDRRLATLDDLGHRARAAGPLTEEHEAAIVATTSQQAEGLTGLRAEVVAATTAVARREACRRVVPDFRVYVLTRPKVHLTIAADAVTAAAARLDQALTALDASAAAAEAAGRDVTAARAEIEAARAGVAAARSLAGGVPGAVLPLEPAGYPANAGVLTTSRSSLGEARGKARAAAQDVEEARRLLQP